MQEYLYALYAGENGWGTEDTLYLIQPNGVVKKVKKAFKNRHFLKDSQMVRHLQWELMPGMLISIPELCVDNIPNKPKYVTGMDGTRITAYCLKEDRIRKLWTAEDYGQIEVYNLIKMAYRAAEDSPLRTNFASWMGNNQEESGKTNLLSSSIN